MLLIPLMYAKFEYRIPAPGKRTLICTLIIIL